MSEFADEGEASSRERLAVEGSPVIQHFNLSQHKSLRTLEITAKSIPLGVYRNPKFNILRVTDFLKTVLSSITFPESLDVVVIYRDVCLRGTPLFSGCNRGCRCDRHYWMTQLEMNDDNFQEHLKMFRGMHDVRDFRLVICVDSLDCMVGGVELMKRIVDAEKAKGGFDFLYCEPSLICERRTLRTRSKDSYLGRSRKWELFASAL